MERSGLATAAPWAAVAGDEGPTKTVKTGSARRGVIMVVVRRPTDVANR